ncbi:MAG: M23 family metallopeptidase, partial [Candidatus Binataceae bacterium]
HLYDAHGDVLGARTLRFPVHFKFISSGFSFHRYHPLLHIYRPHLGVDLATDYGAPVKSVGDGRVTEAGWCGELGRCVRIEHRGDITSVYGHLSKISPGIHPGASVHVSQVIGRVGSSGLSTGPHLHWAMEKGDRYVNPLTLRLGANHPISPRMRGVFDQLRAKYMLALSKLPDFGIPAGAPSTELADTPAAGKRLVRFRHRSHYHHRHHRWRAEYRTAETGGEAGGL